MYRIIVNRLDKNGQIEIMFDINEYNRGYEEVMSICHESLELHPDYLIDVYHHIVHLEKIPDTTDINTGTKNKGVK